MSEMQREFSDRRGGLDAESVGPFEEFRVVVNGWTVPRLQAQYNTQGVYLSFDDRYGLDLPADIAGTVLHFIANIIAVERGWSSHPTSPDWEPPTGYWDANGPPQRLLPWFRLSGVQLDESEESGSED